MKDRPFGVTFIAILLSVEAIFQIIAALALFGVSIAGFFTTSYTGAATVIFALGTVSLMVGVIELAVSAGFFSMAKWAWVVAVMVAWIDVVFDVINGLAQAQSFSAVLISMIIPVVVLVYLYQKNIRKLFY